MSVIYFLKYKQKSNSSENIRNIIADVKLPRRRHLMANPKWSIFIYLVVIFFMAALALYVMGGMIYHKDHYAKSIHVENSCEVIASNYYESKCTGSRGSTYVCFRPVWLVFYSISQDVTEIPITAKIEHDGFRTTADAENNLNQYQVSGTVTKQT